MLTMLVAALLVPPPVAGDDRTAILTSVNSLIDALTSSDAEAVDALLESEGSMVSIDLTSPGASKTSVVSFAQLRKDVAAEGPPMTENLGVPTVLQRGPIAQVWVPYSFAINGKLSHCGMDAFTLVNRQDRWRITSLVYTVEAPAACAALAAPKVAE